MFDVCTTGDTAHIDTIFKFLPHTRSVCGKNLNIVLNILTFSQPLVLSLHL